MTGGRLIAVVGASGVGKDSVMAGIATARPDIRLVRRTITRAADLGGEAYDAVTPDAFDAAARGGAFCLHWQAHGLRYGIPASVLDGTRRGEDHMANLSRGALAEARQVFPALRVLHITARPETLTARLVQRGREDAADMATRLARAGAPLPAGLDIVEIRNDGALDDAVRLAVQALTPTVDRTDRVDAIGP